MNQLAKMLARKFVLAKHFKGAPKLSDFQLVEETLSTDLKDGGILTAILIIIGFTNLYFTEILAKAEWFTVDPYMRGRMVQTMKEGDQMLGSQVARLVNFCIVRSHPLLATLFTYIYLSARVLKSRCAEFPEGSQVVGNFGWRDLTIYKPEPNGIRFYSTIHRLPEMKGLPDSYAVSTF